MTVWVVSEGGGWDYYAVAVFSTEEKAKAWVARKEAEANSSSWMIEPFPVDEPQPQPGDKDYQPWNRPGQEAQ